MGFYVLIASGLKLKRKHITYGYVDNQRAGRVGGGVGIATEEGGVLVKSKIDDCTRKS